MAQSHAAPTQCSHKDSLARPPPTLGEGLHIPITIFGLLHQTHQRKDTKKTSSYERNTKIFMKNMTRVDPKFHRHTHLRIYAKDICAKEQGELHIDS